MSQDILIYSPFGCDGLEIEYDARSQECLVYQAAMMENVGALWVISAGNLGNMDLEAMRAQFDLLTLSLSNHVTSGSKTFQQALPAIKEHFAHCDFSGSEHDQPLTSANLQIRSCNPFVRDFFLSGIRQVVCEKHADLFQHDEGFTAIFERLAELSALHQREAEQFNRLGELSFVVSRVFSAIRQKMLQRRLFPYTDKMAFDFDLDPTESVPSNLT